MPNANSYKSIIKKVFQDQNAFASTMMIAALDLYNTEMLTWSPVTIKLETEQDLGFVWDSINFDRLMSGTALITTDRFYKSLPDFIELCNVLSGSGISPEVFDPADALECAWGITEALLLAPPDDEEPFTEEIRGYIGKVLDQEGIIQAPDILRIAIRDKDNISRITNDFSDDPELFGAIWKNENAKTQEINDIVKERLLLLTQQLAALPLVNGNAAELIEKIQQNMSAK